jgi:hypothetical protein
MITIERATPENEVIDNQEMRIAAYQKKMEEAVNKSCISAEDAFKIGMAVHKIAMWIPGNRKEMVNKQLRIIEETVAKYIPNKKDDDDWKRYTE